jgi:HPt (histidine-containing phosphotransfer) domain-containing protein
VHAESVSQIDAPADLYQISLQALMDMEVTSVSKREQKFSQAAAATGTAHAGAEKLLAIAQDPAIAAGIRQRDPAVVGRAAHSLKSTSATVGAVGLSGAAAALEHSAREADWLVRAQGRLSDLRIEFERVRPKLTEAASNAGEPKHVREGDRRPASHRVK